MAKTYYSDIIGIHSQMMRERDTGRFWRNPRAGFLMLLLFHKESHRAHSSHSKKNAAICMLCFCPRQPIRDSAFNDFVGGWLHRHTLPIMYQNSRPQKEMRCSINHIVRINSLGTINSSYQLRNGGNTENTKYLKPAIAILASRPF